MSDIDDLLNDPAKRQLLERALAERQRRIIHTEGVAPELSFVFENRPTGFMERGQLCFAPALRDQASDTGPRRRGRKAYFDPAKAIIRTRWLMQKFTEAGGISANDLEEHHSGPDHKTTLAWQNGKTSGYTPAFRRKLADALTRAGVSCAYSEVPE